MMDEKYLYTEESFDKDGFSKEIFKSKIKPDLEMFDSSELKIIITISDHFKNMTAAELSRFSHKEKAWRETNDGDLISYAFAEYLQL